jgi:hypothetical protein
MPKNKIHPKCIPRTEADVRRAFGLGYTEGMKLIMDVMVYTLGCECDMPDDWLDFYHDRFMKTLDCRMNGELTDHDIQNATYQEKGWEIKTK